MGLDETWSPARLIDFISASFYREYPGIYCCYLNDRAELRKIELMAVGNLAAVQFRAVVLAKRAERFGATAVVLGYSDPAGFPLCGAELSKLRALARDLDSLNLSLIEFVRISPTGVDRHRLA